MQDLGMILLLFERAKIIVRHEDGFIIKQELARILLQAWELIGQGILDHLVEGMEKRIQAVYKVKKAGIPSIKTV